MYVVIIIAALLVSSILCPRLTRYMLIAPILGTTFGGFTWCIAAMWCSDLITIKAFETFITGGFLLAEACLFISSRR